MSEAKKCVLWGMGEEYERILNQVLFEVYKGNMSVEAMICRKEDKYCSVRDGFPVITKEELKPGTFDYLIITSTVFYEEIKQEAMVMVETESQIINGQVFSLRLFDFKRYVKLLENPVTILSDNCWGV